MSSPAKSTGATVVPGMCYRDAAAAIEWLCRVWGFSRRDLEGRLWSVGTYNPWAPR